MAAPRPSLLTSTSTRRREPSTASLSRGSSSLAATGAWGAPSTGADLSTSLRKKGGPSLSFAGTGESHARGEAIHPLKFNWDVWFSHRSAAKPKRDEDKRETDEWEHGLTNLGGFSSVESLHPFLAHLTCPSAFPSSIASTASIFNPPPEGDSTDSSPSQSNFTSEINVFRSPIQPSWEDPHNVGGGRWVLRMRKGVADRVWEEVVFALVGERLGGEEGTPEAGAGDKINGVVISVRKDEDILGLWCAPSSRPERDAIRESLRAALEPLLGQAGAAALQLDYKPHPSSNAAGPHTPGHFAHQNGHHHTNRRHHNGEQRAPGGGDRERPDGERGSNRRVAGFGNYASPRGARDQSRDGSAQEERSTAFGERRAGAATGEGRPRRGSGGERDLTQRSSATAWGRL